MNHTINYIDPPTRGYATEYVSCALGGFAFLVVSGRIYARAIVQKNSGYDDCVLLLGLLPTIGFLISACLASTHYQANRHVWDIEPRMFKTLSMLTFVSNVCYYFAIGLIKISVLLFYRRLGKHTISKVSKYFILATIASIALYTLGSIIVSLVTCIPTSAIWNQFDNGWKATHSYKCNGNIQETPWLLASGIINLVHDLLTATFPIVFLASLIISKREKVALGAVFGIGYLVCAVGGLRLYYISIFASHPEDETWINYDVVLWSVVEILVGIIAASAPSLQACLIICVFFRGFLQSDSHASSNWSLQSNPQQNYARDDNVAIPVAAAWPNANSRSASVSAFSHITDTSMNIEEERKVEQGFV